MKIQTRFLVAFLVMATIPLLIQGALYFNSYNRGLEGSFRNRLQSVAAIQESRLVAILKQNEERLALVASRTQLRISLRRYLAGGEAADQQKMVRILNDAVGSIADLVEITIYAPDGVAVASTRPARIGQKHFDEALFRLSRERNVVDRLFLDEEGHSRVFLTGPVELEGENLGAIVLRSDVQNLLASLADYSGLGETGETVLFRPDGEGGYVFLAPTRFDADAALRAPVRMASAVVAASPGGDHHPLVRARDYRDQEVLVIPRTVPATDWILAVKVDRAEAFGGLYALARFSLIMLGVLLLGVMVGAIWLARGLSAPLVHLSDAAHEIAAGHYEQKLAVNSTGEIRVLQESFNHMSDQITRAMAEIKSLEGIIPICASCKKIRDDQGYWQQLEAYLVQHSEAMFSHGICPECYEKTQKEIDELEESGGL